MNWNLHIICGNQLKYSLTKKTIEILILITCKLVKLPAVPCIDQPPIMSICNYVSKFLTPHMKFTISLHKIKDKTVFINYKMWR